MPKTIKLDITLPCTLEELIEATRGFGNQFIIANPGGGEGTLVYDSETKTLQIESDRRISSAEDFDAGLMEEGRDAIGKSPEAVLTDNTFDNEGVATPPEDSPTKNTSSETVTANEPTSGPSAEPSDGQAGQPAGTKTTTKSSPRKGTKDEDPYKL